MNMCMYIYIYSNHIGHAYASGDDDDDDDDDDDNDGGDDDDDDDRRRGDHLPRMSMDDTVLAWNTHTLPARETW